MLFEKQTVKTLIWSSLIWVCIINIGVDAYLTNNLGQDQKTPLGALCLVPILFALMFLIWIVFKYTQQT